MTDKHTHNFARSIIYLLSPFLSLPLILHGIYEKNKLSVFFLIGILSLVSYLYIPSISNDKAYYYLLFNDFKRLQFDYFLFNFLAFKTDYIFYFLIYLFAQLKLPLHLLFLLITFVTLTNFYLPFLKLVNKLGQPSNKIYLLFVLLLLTSFSPAGLFSGVRYIFAISFTFLAFSYLVFDDKISIKGILFLVIASLIHFSTLVFIPLYIILFIFKNKHNLFLTLFFLSFIFIFLPRGVLMDNILGFGLSEVLESKTQGYLGENDFTEQSLEQGNFNNYLKIVFQTIWVFIAYFYLIFKRKNKSILKNAFLLILTICNVFYSAPTIYSRYLYLALAFFIFWLIYDYLKGVRNIKIIYVLFLVLSLNFFGNIYGMREYFKSSLFDLQNITLPTLLIKEDIKYNDIKQ